VDLSNSRVRKITPEGIITTVAGGGRLLDDGVAATDANLIPVNVTVDAAGNLYVGDYRSHKIRRIDRAGIITSVAGNGKVGFSGDGGPASAAQLSFVFAGLSVDSAGNLYLAEDFNSRIRRIAGGVIDTVAGNGLFRFSGNGGPGTSATLFIPTGVAADSAGNVYFTEQTLNRIRKIAPDGTVSVIGGSGMLGYSGDGGPATGASLSFPTFLTTDSAGAIYFADTINNAVRRIDRNGTITTVAGNGTSDFSGDRGPATRAALAGPNGIHIDDAGNLFICDKGNNRIRKVASDGTISTIAGTGASGFFGDNGPASQAQLNAPAGVRIHNGMVYFSDSGNHRVRRIDANGIISTVAGNGLKGFSGDRGLAASASLNNPQGLVFDAAGNLYIADQANHAVRTVAADGIITTFAGRAGEGGYSGDGGPATDARLGVPTDLAFDSSGNLLIADLGNHRIRAVLAAAPTFHASPEIFALTAPAGSSPVEVQINVVGSIPGIPFTASAITIDGDWLKISPSAGSLPATLRVTIDPSVLAADLYAGAIYISTPTASPSEQVIFIFFTATATGDPSLEVKAASVNYAFVRDSPALTRVLPISNAGGGSLNFTVDTFTTSGGAWLSASTAKGTTGAFGSAAVTISANPAGLGPGAYSGTVLVSNPPRCNS
jgi:hypothetical protein